MSQFFVAAHDWCYTVNENSKSGLHIVSGPYATKDDADSAARVRINSHKTKHLVLEVVGGYDLVPAQIIEIPGKIVKV